MLTAWSIVNCSADAVRKARICGGSVKIEYSLPHSSRKGKPGVKRRRHFLCNLVLVPCSARKGCREQSDCGASSLQGVASVYAPIADNAQ